MKRVSANFEETDGLPVKPDPEDIFGCFFMGEKRLEESVFAPMFNFFRDNGTNLVCGSMVCN